MEIKENIKLQTQTPLPRLDSNRLKIYGISGLGADKRVFDYLKLNAKFYPIAWIEPLKNESISEYSKRLSQVIDTSKKFCLIGVSFGGLIAVEMNKFILPELTILISSAETKNEIRPMFRFFGKLNLIKIIPVKLFKPPVWLLSYFFGTRKTQLLKNILDDTDLPFAKWAVNELVNWENVSRIENVIKIHGSKDRLIPVRGERKMEIIKDGGHFMIVDKADEISNIINSKLGLIG